jgi:peroxiredoxin
MKKGLKSSLILSFILLFIMLGHAKAEELKEGDSLTEFVLLNGLTKKDISFDNDIKGKSKYTAIIFANTSCGACRKELKILSALSSKYGDLTTYVILIDMRGKEVVEDFAEQLKYNVTYLLDPQFTIPPVYGFNFTPSLLIVDREGTIIYKKGGYSIRNDEDTIMSKIKELMH